jgi:hypothetical protein
MTGDNLCNTITKSCDLFLKEFKQSFWEDGSLESLAKMFQVVQGQYEHDNTLGQKFRQAYFAN